MLQRLEFWPYPFKHCNSNPYYSKHWSLSSYFLNTGFPILSFETLEFLCYPRKHWNCAPIPVLLGILAVSFETLYLLFHFPHIGILVSFFRNFGFLAYILPNISPILPNIAFLVAFFKHWSFYLIFP